MIGFPPISFCVGVLTVPIALVLFFVLGFTGYGWTNALLLSAAIGLLPPLIAKIFDN